jgi:hypothetical protein
MCWTKLDLCHLPIVHEREEAFVHSIFLSFFWILSLHAWYLRPIFLLLEAMIPPTIHLVFRMYLTNTEEPSGLAGLIHPALIHSFFHGFLAVTGR